MGSIFSTILSRLYSKTPVRILMVGLDAAGKTTILYQLKIGEIVHTIPTIGFNVETVDYKNISFTVYDVGSQTFIRPLWRYYYTNTKGIIFVVDSTDTERLKEAEEEFRNLLSQDELRNASILVLANKQDLENAMTPAEIGERLGLFQLRGRQWHLQGTCATQAEGIVEGLDWLSNSDNVIGMDGSLSSTGIPVSLDEIPVPVIHPRVFIDRDYSISLAVRFSTDLPPDLTPFIDANTFESTIEEINDIFKDAEKCGARSFCETITTVLTFNLIHLCRKTYYEKCLVKVEKLISAKNRNVFKRRGLRMVDPFNHGLRTIEIIIVDHEFRN